MTSVRLRAFAKINLSLEILNRRADGYHNLRTVFQTITLSDRIEIEAARSTRTQIDVQSDIEIPGENLMVRAAQAVLENTGVSARVRMRLKKNIPMGAGLGGGSTDAAAVVAALPGLLRKPLASERLMELAATLGSDVPVFLMGGTVLGLDRGTELYPLPDLPPLPVLVVSSGVHVSTAEACRSLARTGDEPAGPNDTAGLTRAIGQGSDWSICCRNDFERSVYSRHPELARIRRKLVRLGARPALLTGSGSALFGIFATREDRDRAADQFPANWAYRVSLIPRRKYRTLLERSLKAVC